MIINFARRAHDHNWELDPDYTVSTGYRFLQTADAAIHLEAFPEDTRFTFTLLNRSIKVRLGELIDTNELRDQLEQTKKLRFHKSELVWLAGNTFYGRRGIFEPAFLEWLERDFRLSDYELSMQRRTVRPLL